MLKIQGDSERLRIFTPKTLKNALLWHFHDSYISGHQADLKENVYMDD